MTLQADIVESDPTNYYDPTQPGYVDPVYAMDARLPQSSAMRFAAVRQDGEVLLLVPQSERTADLCLAAVQSNGRAIRFVPVELQSDGMRLAAVLSNGLALEYVDRQSRGLCMAALSQNLNSLQFVRDQTADICVMVIEQRGSMLKHVREESQIEELCRMSMNAALCDGLEDDALAYPLAMIKNHALRAQMAAEYGQPCPADPVPPAPRLKASATRHASGIVGEHSGGHDYTNDATWAFAASIYSFQSAHHAVAAWCAAIGPDARLTPEGAKEVLSAAALKAMNFNMSTTPAGDIDWCDIANEFDEVSAAHAPKPIVTHQAAIAKIHQLLGEADASITSSLSQLGGSDPEPVKPPRKKRATKADKDAIAALATPDADLATAPVSPPAGRRSMFDEGPDAGAPTETATRSIDAAVMVVLRECSVTDKAVFLPPAQLDPKLYKKVNDVLSALGGKWNRTIGGHKFAEDPREVLAAVQATGMYMNAKDFGFFPTPKALAARAAALLSLQPGMRVLEPSAGGGALADEAAVYVGTACVDTVEYLQMNVDLLRNKGYAVIGRDFLAMQPEPIYDALLLNPPFGQQMDMRHIEHAARFLKPDGRLVAIMSPSFQTRSTKVAESFRALMAVAGDHEEEIAAGTFRESGTDIRTVLIAMDASRFPWNVEAAEEAQRERSSHLRQRVA